MIFKAFLITKIDVQKLNMLHSNHFNGHLDRVSQPALINQAETAKPNHHSISKNRFNKRLMNQSDASFAHLKRTHLS